MKRIFGGLVVALILVAPGVAYAHGDVESTTPADGDHVAQPPEEVLITFSQPPTADSRFEVLDGCDDDVLADVEGEGPNAVLKIAGGSTGSWTVRYRVISATDGHSTRGNFSFLVGRGPLRCDEPGLAVETPDAMVTSPPAGAASDDGESGDFPIAPVLIGGGVIVALAAAVRMMSTR